MVAPQPPGTRSGPQFGRESEENLKKTYEGRRPPIYLVDGPAVGPTGLPRRPSTDPLPWPVAAGLAGDHRPMTQLRPHLQTVLVAGIAAIASSLAVAGTTPEFVLAPISAFVVAVTPAQVITFSILVLGSLGSKIGFVLAIGLGISLFGGIAAVMGWLAERYAPERWVDTLGFGGAGVVAALVGYALVGAPISAAASGLGAAAGALLIGRLVHVPSASPESERRRFLGALAAVAGFSGAALLTGREVVRRTQPTVEEVFGPRTGDGSSSQEVVEGLLDDARAQSFDVDGLSPLVSEIGSFYEVDINSIDPDVDATTWSLSITGAVNRPFELSYEEITAIEPDHRFITLRCVGESLNGHKMDNALWTGVPVGPLIEAADPKGEYVMLRAADGYFEEFPLEALRDGFLAYGMNGEVLPRGHGYPVRALIPGHWGEINVKWITQIEVLTREMDGFWEQRGWHGTGPVNTVAKLWTDNRLSDGRVEVGGHAYAGTRGIQLVEVSTDGGATWTDAELGPKLPGTDVWRQWRHTFEPPTDASSAEVVVRATDGTGTLQPMEEAQPFPSGATGWVRKTIRL